MKNSLLAHLRDILILPFTVTVIIPYYTRPRLGESDLLSMIFGIILTLCGLSIFLYTVFLFKSQGKGTLAPWSPKEKLVITGPYRYCRNPMITGVLTILLGESMFFHSTSILLWAGAFLLINTTYFFIFEEPDLQARFGDEYLEYKRNVPRWIPKDNALPWQKVKPTPFWLMSSDNLISFQTK